MRKSVTISMRSSGKEPTININISKVKIFVMVPTQNVERVRNVVCEAGAGIIGNYSYCTSSTEVSGTFLPNKNANPFIGENNRLEFVKEEKLEFVCEVNNIKKVISKVKEAHPYEEPAIDIVPLLDLDNFQ